LGESVERIKALSELDTASVADILGGKGTMHSSIGPLQQGMHLIGRAYTVTTPPGDMLSCYVALENCPKGMVLVVGGGGYTEAAIWGSLMTYQAKIKGLAGIVIDGAVRDTETIRNLGLPVFCISSSPRDGTIRTLGDVEVNITCGGACVKPGDYILGDADGVVVIPQEYIDHVIEKAKDTKEMERTIFREIDAGKSLYELLGLHDIVERKKTKDISILSDLIKDINLP
jgi:regulator of RNase E activity RraA